MTALDEHSIPPERLKSEDGIGARLRARRKVRKMSLQEVARRSDISIGLLSQIERGLSLPTVRSLTAICAALEMPVSWLFDAPDSDAWPSSPLVVRRAQRRVLDLGAKGMVKELMTPDACDGVQMMRIVIRPGGSTGDTPYNHPSGAKCGTVLSGVLGIEGDGVEHRLQPGDAIAFDATCMIRLYTVGDAEVELLWVVSPAVY
jgi:transcriptional regulator with XRE-family HTH domain